VKLDASGANRDRISPRGLMEHRRRMIDSDDLSATCQTCGHLYGDPGPEADLEDAISICDLQELDHFLVPLEVRRARGHEEAGERSDDAGRAAELGDELASKGSHSWSMAPQVDLRSRLTSRRPNTNMLRVKANAIALDIAEVARAAGVPASTLRFYEEK